MLFSCLQLVRILPMRLFVLISVFALASCGGGGGSSSTNTGTTVSSDATLSALTISSGKLLPSFLSSNTSYNDSVGSTVSTVTVNATTTNSNATVSVNSGTATTSTNSTVIPLSVGSNTVSIVVTAQDGTTTKSYSITVTRPDPFTDATLSALSISSGQLSPKFDSATIGYTDTVDNSVSSVTLNATTTNTSATLTVNGTQVTSGTNSGAISLGVGSTSIPVVVTAQDGSTTKTYTITVKRLPALSALSLTNASYTPVFQSTQLSYDSTVNFLVNAIGVTATTNDSGDSLTIDSNSATSGTLFSPVYLATGNSNTVATKVTSSDGQASQTYNIAVTRNSSLSQQEYNAPDAAINDYFGVSIAISGNTMVVGADLKSTSTFTFNGAAYVYTYDKSLGNWVYQTTLTANSPANSDHFGQSVDIDGNTIVVGAPQQDTAGFNAGAVYVFTGSGNSWTQQAMLTASDATTNGDKFGSSVSISGNTLVVGSPFYTGGGAAYVFVNNGTSGSGWATATQAKLPASNLGTNDLYGNSVAIDKNTVVVGAPGHVISSNVTGAAYVFTGGGTSWTEQPMLSASNGVGGDQFGQTVAVSGNTIAVGATGVSAGAGTGAAYVFYNDGSSWKPQAEVQASNKASGDAFGYSIALSGERLVVGADTETGTSASQSGAAYVFMRNNTNNTISWSQTAYLKAIDAAASDYFGSSVGIDNDKLVIGAQNKTVTTSAGAQTSAGVVYTFQ